MLVSIIMPVYQVEAFVAKAIESVLNQTFSEFECFLIDDGSADHSGAICDAYAKRDRRVHVIHQENQGPSAARNTGLALARGKYVYFMDSDDWIEPDMLGKMCRLAEINHAELVVTGFCMEYCFSGREVTYRTPCPDRIYQTIEEFRRDAHNYLNNSLLSLPWNKLFRLDRIQREDIHFQNKKWDDHYFCMDYLMNCEKVVLSSMTGYHWYRSRQGAETQLNYSDVMLYQTRAEHCRRILRLYQHWGIQDEASVSDIASYYVGRLFQCVQEMADNPCVSGEEKRRRVRDMLCDPMTVEALAQAKGFSVPMRILVWPMRRQCVRLSLLFGICISAVRKAAPGLFIRLKEREVHGA